MTQRRNRPAAFRLAAIAIVATALCAGPTLITPVAAQTTYSQWQPPITQDAEVKTLLDQLKTMIGKAEQAQAADPQFITDLRNLIAAYENPWSTRLLFDDFSDGNYTANPKWTVSAGKYTLDPKGPHRGLQSKIVPEGVQTGQKIQIGSITLGTLGTGQTGAGGHASIYTPVKISNAFRIEMVFTSKEKFGRWDFGPYQGASGNVAYRLAYFPGVTPGLQLLKVTAQGTTVLASYSQALRLEGDKEHTIVWTRDRSGLMHVAVDGQQLIAIADTGIKQPFDGFLMVNSGGSFSVRSIAISGRPV
ncbi:MAG: hypothetical protein WD044_11665 [Dongiaceae bacterium]